MDDTSTGCLLPLAQSVITGAIMAGATWAAASLAEAEQPALLAALVGALAACAVWLSGLRAWRRVTYRLEDLTGEDYNGDGEIGEPQTVRVEVTQAEGQGRHTAFIELPASIEQLTRLAAGLLEGAPFSEAHWTGAAGGFTRGEFSQLRAELIRRGLARWNNPGTPARGAALTPAGRAVMGKFASMAAGPRPTLSPRGEGKKQ